MTEQEEKCVCEEEEEEEERKRGRGEELSAAEEEDLKVVLTELGVTLQWCLSCLDPLMF